MYDYQYNYKKIPKKSDGWVDANAHKPLSYKIVKLKTNEREVNGWWQETEWFIRKPRENEVVISWQKSKEVHNI